MTVISLSSYILCCENACTVHLSCYLNEHCYLAIKVGLQCQLPEWTGGSLSTSCYALLQCPPHWHSEVSIIDTGLFWGKKKLLDSWIFKYSHKYIITISSTIGKGTFCNEWESLNMFLKESTKYNPTPENPHGVLPVAHMAAWPGGLNNSAVVHTHIAG